MVTTLSLWQLDELLKLGDVFLFDVAFAHNIQRFDAVHRQPTNRAWSPYNGAPNIQFNDELSRRGFVRKSYIVYLFIYYLL